MAYVTRKKVELSKKMLENTVSSIASVSDTLGFADQSHFSKSFKAMTGLVPSKYRKMLIK